VSRVLLLLAGIFIDFEDDARVSFFFFFILKWRCFSTTPQVMVVTSEGFLYQYNIDLENGGECVLLKQYSLLEQTTDMSGN
jgi:hypothetical protein